MKKIGKKRKVIGLTAIVLILVILALVITKNITRNTKISNEGYFEITANANSNLVASYIKEGITIGGITGTLEVLDTSDATAQPEDIAQGKTAYVNGVKITGTRIVSTLGTVTGNETENSYVNDKYGNQVVVPAGFKVVNPNDDVTKGIVIEDVSAPGATEYTKGSQFVWIPVGDVYTSAEHNEENKEIITLGRYTFDSNGDETLVQSAENWNNTSTDFAINSTRELANATNANYVAKNLKDFMERVSTNSGYYIGRYELGDENAKNSQHSNSGVTNPAVCKSAVYPYNWITQQQASSLCRSMYNSSKFESDLTNSYAWDTAIIFIQAFSNKSYSMQAVEKSLTKCGEKNDVECNIYDMAGNVSEWSTETNSDVNLPCVYRGSNYSINAYSSYRKNFYRTVNVYGYYSCRPIIYL